ncbi:hypothetical protein HYPBUDRAFT_6096 [Hyphopichia burtonii NRRL Y-1933]|uniref:Uncharacterized protein n=1 Tax=Hyphopichia burtonii NRRL Y-1933 TaxID=984485 RepID=A0A1E4RHP2_9ASCO|nr:hypothetical protein HYPBUDRAFT_6096 [Hyphopichia burtonii NRRL Y-1933]ODV66770.1 hypothetical protein HYPBUDRAFT_6096 [Hyphopichia burtonii NRRL Y-1933]
MFVIFVKFCNQDIPKSQFSALCILAFAAAAVTSPTYDPIVYKFDAQVLLDSDDPLNGVAIEKVGSHPFVFLVGGDEGKDLSLTLNDQEKTLIDQDELGFILTQTLVKLGV